MTASSPVALDYVAGLAPYVPGRPIEDVARELGLDPATIVKLASNENPRGPSPKVLAAIAAAAVEVTRYPDGFGYHLKDALAKRFDVAPSQIVLGNGSNDILELATMAYLRPGDAAVYSQHAFAVYPLATHARGATGIEVPARDLGHDLAAMRAAITPLTRVVFVANPNNPTGTFIAPAALEAFIDSVPRDVLVVLDEAYNEYLEPADRVDSIGWVKRYPHLAVSRSFSKAYGLAALRIGYGVMNDRGRRHDESRAPAVQRQCAGAGGSGGRARRRRLRRRLARAEPAGTCAAVRGIRRASALRTCPRMATSCWRRSATPRGSTRRCCASGVIVRPVASYGLPEWLRDFGRFAGGERAVPGASRSVSE